MRQANAADASSTFAAARAGSRTALGELLEGCRQYLLLVANQELGDDLRAKGGASDLVQETFLEAQRDFPQFSGTTCSELRAWLRRLLLNNLAGFERSYRRTARRRLARELSLDAKVSHAGLAELLAADTPSPSQVAVRREEHESLESALKSLSEEHSQVLRLRHQERLTFEEIGGRMNRSADAARMLWSRACERLASALERRHGWS